MELGAIGVCFETSMGPYNQAQRNGVWSRNISRKKMGTMKKRESEDKKLEEQRENGEREEE